MLVNSKKYKDLEDLYKRYSKLVSLLVFEGRKYKFKDAKVEGGYKLHLYHCEDERHYILIHLKKEKAVLVQTFYSVEEVKV
ncbi:MAG: hypothetical protein RR603_03045 [Kurthia sp.]